MKRRNFLGVLAAAIPVPFLRRKVDGSNSVLAWSELPNSKTAKAMWSESSMVMSDETRKAVMIHECMHESPLYHQMLANGARLW